MTLVYNNGTDVLTPNRVCLQGPVNYSVVGSPAIVAGVASGFDGTSYLSLTNNLAALTNTYEMQVCIEDGDEITNTPYQRLLNFYKPSNTTQLSIFAYADSTSAISYFMQGVNYADPDNPTSKQKRLLHNTSRNQKLVIRVISDGTSITGSIYDATSGTLLGEGVEQGYYAIDLSLVTQIRIGSYSGGAPWKGTIDLNRTYIKINQKLWFGKQQAQAVTCNGTTVWGQV